MIASGHKKSRAVTADVQAAFDLLVDLCLGPIGQYSAVGIADHDMGLAIFFSHSGQVRGRFHDKAIKATSGDPVDQNRIISI